jgi:hypothetical protein
MFLHFATFVVAEVRRNDDCDAHVAVTTGIRRTFWSNIGKM